VPASESIAFTHAVQTRTRAAAHVMTAGMIAASDRGNDFGIGLLVRPKKTAAITRIVIPDAGDVHRHAAATKHWQRDNHHAGHHKIAEATEVIKA
jgi:hypothetical protein